MQSIARSSDIKDTPVDLKMAFIRSLRTCTHSPHSGKVSACSMPAGVSLEEDKEVCGRVLGLSQGQVGVDLGQRNGKLPEIDAPIVVQVCQREQLVQRALVHALDCQQQALCSQQLQVLRLGCLQITTDLYKA